MLKMQQFRMQADLKIKKEKIMTKKYIKMIIYNMYKNNINNNYCCLILKLYKIL